MFLEKHWFTLLLSAIALTIAANAKAATETNGYIERTQYMYDKAYHGANIPDVHRMYDSETDTLCYRFSDTAGWSCLRNRSQAVRDKYAKYHGEAMERRAKEAGLK